MSVHNWLVDPSRTTGTLARRQQGQIILQRARPAKDRDRPHRWFIILRKSISWRVLIWLAFRGEEEGLRMSANPENVTILLQQCRGGDQGALDQLMPVVYEELRRDALLPAK